MFSPERIPPHFQNHAKLYVPTQQDFLRLAQEIQGYNPLIPTGIPVPGQQPETKGAPKEAPEDKDK